MKAELEAGCGALDGHLVELVLRVLGKAGVAGVVGVGRFHGGGARAERAIHEALEHTGVKQGIAGVVVGAVRFQFVEGLFEGKPLADAEVEACLPFPFARRRGSPASR